MGLTSKVRKKGRGSRGQGRGESGELWKALSEEWAAWAGGTDTMADSGSPVTVCLCQVIH